MGFAHRIPDESGLAEASASPGSRLLPLAAGLLPWVRLRGVRPPDWTMRAAVSLYCVSGSYGPRNFGPLKWIMWPGFSAIQTSVSHATSAAYWRKSARVRKAVT